MKTDSRASDLVLAVAITAVFVAIQITASLNAGTLSFPPTYDDIGYYNDAARRVQLFWERSPGAVLRDYVANAPHAPGATLIAAIGFLLFGLHPWAADAANALPLFLFVSVIIRLLSGLPFGLKALATSALVLIPMFGLAIVEFRPDMWCAGFTVLGTLLIALRDPRDLSVAAWAGACFAAALLMKPTFSPLVIILYGSALVLRLAPYLRTKQQWLVALASCLTVAGIGILIAGPHYVLTLPRLIDYYRVHVFGSGAAIWSPALSKIEHALYYVTGPGGVPSLGAWVYLGALTLLAPVVLYAAKRRELAWRAAIVVILAAIAYAVVTVPGNKSGYLGVIFPGYVIAGIILSVTFTIQILYRRGRETAAYAAALLIFLFALGVYRLPRILLHTMALPPEVAMSRHVISDEVTNYLAEDRYLDRKTVMFAQIGQYMNPDTLMFALTQRGKRLPTFVGDYFVADMKKQIELLGQSHYVITLTSDYPSGVSWLPGAKIADQVNAILGPQTGFELVKTIVPANDPGEIRVYRRIGS